MDNSYGLLEAGLNELGLSIALDKINALMAFLGLMEKWNKTYNLTAIRNKEGMAVLHILDSLAVLPYLQGTRVLDVGTGAGLPGIPLAIYQPEMNFFLLDSNAKKTRFVQQVVLELGLKNVHVCHFRVEEYHDSEGFNCIVSRAFSSLQEMVEKTRHLIHENSLLLAMKGQKPDAEFERLSMPGEIISLHVPGIDAERCLVRIQIGEVYG